LTDRHRVAGALALTGADLGNIQIADPATGSLMLVTQAGFGPEFLEYFTVVDGWPRRSAPTASRPPWGRA
jgi:hypothetical protein